MDWSYLADEPSYEIRYRTKYGGKDGNEGKATTKMYAATMRM